MYRFTCSKNLLQVPPLETRGQITVNTVNTGNKEKKRESRLLSASSSVCVYCYIHLQNLINNCCLNIKNKAFKILFHFLLLKEIVHPKMKILSSFTHPQVVSNLYEFLCSAEHKGRYSEESL